MINMNKNILEQALKALIVAEAGLADTGSISQPKET